MSDCSIEEWIFSNSKIVEKLGNQENNLFLNQLETPLRTSPL